MEFIEQPIKEQLHRLFKILEVSSLADAINKLVAAKRARTESIRLRKENLELKKELAIYKEAISTIHDDIRHLRED